MTPVASADEVLSDTRLGVVRGTTYGLFGAPEEFVPQARALGAGIVRVNLFWSQIEPEPGRFVWDALDALLDRLGDGEEAWVTVCSGSRWATRHPTRWLPASPAVDIKQYHRFVRKLVGHRPGRIRFWQCEIEPCLPLFWAGTAGEYLTQLRVFHEAVEQADPAALVVLGAAVPGAMVGDGPAGAQTWASFFGEVLRDGAEHFDVFDIHPYGDPYTVTGLVRACRVQLAAHGCRQPVVASEHSGPLPTEFPENLPYLTDVLAVHQRQFLGQAPMPDTLEDLEAAEDAPVVALYQRMDELPPTLQMFMNGCPPELDDHRHRLACRDMVVRTMLALAEGIRRNLHYAIGPEWDFYHDSRVAGVLMFGKLQLMDSRGDTLTHRHPAADTFELMARLLDGATEVRRITVADRPDLYLFEAERTHNAPALVTWERHISTADRDGSTNEFAWEWPYSSAHAVDAFGARVPVRLQDGMLRIPVSSTPVFIDCPAPPTTRGDAATD
ncbi:hypothetical protein [Nocardia australiensis]|uniref:hypothetical protein n=1 Tax=Nocardia australiensis TaxID=2887191 RepID=UPI001D155532|nr:hypothetical protein [Nocardia australiensis]